MSSVEITGLLVYLEVKVVVLAISSYCYILILILFNLAGLFQLPWQKQTAHSSIDLLINLSKRAQPTHWGFNESAVLNLQKWSSVVP